MNLSISLLVLISALRGMATAQDCLPCADGLEPFILEDLCGNAVELMATLTAGKWLCRSIELVAFKRGRS
jgi:hypothetical protein